MRRRPLLRESDLEPERNVILEEINGVADTPDDLVFEVHAETLWPEHSYGYSILGTPETLGRLRADDLRCLHQTGYHPGNCVVAAAGHLEHGQLLTVLEREGWFEGTARAPAWPAVPAGAATQGRHRVEARDTAQLAAQAAADKLATDVSIVDVSDRLAITDAFVLASAPNERQVQAIVDEADRLSPVLDVVSRAHRAVRSLTVTERDG